MVHTGRLAHERSKTHEACMQVHSLKMIEAQRDLEALNEPIETYNSIPAQLNMIHSSDIQPHMRPSIMLPRTDRQDDHTAMTPMDHTNTWTGIEEDQWIRQSLEEAFLYDEDCQSEGSGGEESCSD
jgi:hypothetical protein